MELRLQDYKTFFKLNSAKHENFSANKYEYENPNNSSFHAQLCLARKNLQKYCLLLEIY